MTGKKRYDTVLHPKSLLMRGHINVYNGGLLVDPNDLLGSVDLVDSHDGEQIPDRDLVRVALLDALAAKLKVTVPHTSTAQQVRDIVEPLLPAWYEQFRALQAQEADQRRLAPVDRYKVNDALTALAESFGKTLDDDVLDDMTHHVADVLEHKPKPDTVTTESLSLEYYLVPNSAVIQTDGETRLTEEQHEALDKALGGGPDWRYLGRYKQGGPYTLSASDFGGPPADMDGAARYLRAQGIAHEVERTYTWSPTTAMKDEVDTEAMIAAWRAENADDESNHNYQGPAYPDTDGAAPACTECGDNQAGLLHAFDPQFPPGFFDEAIVEAYENSRS